MGFCWSHLLHWSLGICRLIPPSLCWVGLQWDPWVFLILQHCINYEKKCPSASSIAIGPQLSNMACSSCCRIAAITCTEATIPKVVLVGWGFCSKSYRFPWNLRAVETRKLVLLDPGLELRQKFQKMALDGQTEKAEFFCYIYGICWKIFYFDVGIKVTNAIVLHTTVCRKFGRVSGQVHWRGCTYGCTWCQSGQEGLVQHSKSDGKYWLKYLIEYLHLLKSSLKTMPSSQWVCSISCSGTVAVDDLRCRTREFVVFSWSAHRCFRVEAWLQKHQDLLDWVANSIYGFWLCDCSKDLAVDLNVVLPSYKIQCLFHRSSVKIPNIRCIKFKQRPQVLS